MFKKSFVYFILFVAMNSSVALDTTEPFDIGFTDNEMYVGFSGAGLGKGEKVLGWEHLIGVGISDRLSTMFFYSLESNEFLGERIGDVGLGLFVTVVDLEIFDFDLIGSVCSHGSFTFAAELNLDFSMTGIQLTIEEGLENGGAAGDEILFSTALAPLFYISMNESLQMLTAIDFIFMHNGDDASITEIGGAGIGLNVGINDAIELITEVNFDIPQGEEKFSTGMSIGFVASLPWAR